MSLGSCNDVYFQIHNKVSRSKKFKKVGQNVYQLLLSLLLLKSLVDDKPICKIAEADYSQ